MLEERAAGRGRGKDDLADLGRGRRRATVGDRLVGQLVVAGEEVREDDGRGRQDDELGENGELKAGLGGGEAGDLLERRDDAPAHRRRRVVVVVGRGGGQRDATRRLALLLRAAGQGDGASRRQRGCDDAKGAGGAQTHDGLDLGCVGRVSEDGRRGLPLLLLERAAVATAGERTREVDGGFALLLGRDGRGLTGDDGHGGRRRRAGDGREGVVGKDGLLDGTRGRDDDGGGGGSAASGRARAGGGGRVLDLGRLAEKELHG